MKRGDDHFSSSACRGCWKDVAAVAEVEAGLWCSVLRWPASGRSAL